MFVHTHQGDQPSPQYPQELYCLRYERVGNDAIFTSWSGVDFSLGVETVLGGQGYSLLAGSTQLLSTYEHGSGAEPRFIVVMCIYHYVFVVSIADVALYNRFMSIYSPSGLVAPLLKLPVKTVPTLIR
jgi:hypothetical protein